MRLTDIEWLRYVTFGIVAGGIIGATNTAAFQLAYSLPIAIAGAVTLTGAIAIVIYAMVSQLLNQLPTADDGTDTEPTEPTAEDTA